MTTRVPMPMYTGEEYPNDRDDKRGRRMHGPAHLPLRQSRSRVNSTPSPAIAAMRASP